jgi:hypothetical protein
MSRWSNWPAPMGLMSTPREPLQGPMRQPGQLLASQENGATARILGEAAGAYLGQARVPIEGLVAIGVTPPAKSGLRVDQGNDNWLQRDLSRSLRVTDTEDWQTLGHASEFDVIAPAEEPLLASQQPPV